MSKTVEENQQEYMRLCHAMQTGVAYEMADGSRDTEPKHLRVGVNAAMRDGASIAKLLVAKGVITEDELWAALAEGMREEVQEYEARLSRSVGRTIKLA